MLAVAAGRLCDGIMALCLTSLGNRMLRWCLNYFLRAFIYPRCSSFRVSKHLVSGFLGFGAVGAPVLKILVPVKPRCRVSGNTKLRSSVYSRKYILFPVVILHAIVWLSANIQIRHNSAKSKAWHAGRVSKPVWPLFAGLLCKAPCIPVQILCMCKKATVDFCRRHPVPFLKIRAVRATVRKEPVVTA